MPSITLYFIFRHFAKDWPTSGVGGVVVGVSMSQWCRYDESEAHQLGTKSSGGRRGEYKQIISSARAVRGFSSSHPAPIRGSDNYWEPDKS